MLAQTTSAMADQCPTSRSSRISKSACRCEEMIIAAKFQGDDRDLARLQHQVYGEALGIIVRRCNRFARVAISILGGNSTHPKWESVDRIDHRTLQTAHDLLAAAWRFETSPPQKRLPMPEGRSNPEFEPDTPEGRWLQWLNSEVASWVDEDKCHDGPLMIRLVLQILANQNQPAGYEAETRLAELIYNRFEHIDWTNADFRD